MKYLWKKQIVDKADIHIDLHDRGYQFGDGLYEVIFVYNGKFFTATEHIERLFTGANKAELALPFTKIELRELLEALIVANEVETGYVYLQVTRGDGVERDHHYPDRNISEPVLSGFTKKLERKEALRATGVDAVTIPDKRWLNCDIKTLSLMGNVMAKNEATKAGVFEVVQHRDGVVTECSSSNLLIIKNGEIITHPDGNLILPGITKIVVERCAKNLNIPYIEKQFTVEELLQADEVFLTSTTSEVLPIVEIDGQKIGNGTPGELSKQLQAEFVKQIEKECGKLN